MTTTDQTRQELLETSIREYREKSPGLTQRERAAFERDIWALRRSIIGGTKPGAMRSFFNDTFGGGPGGYECRSCLINGGELSEPIWAAIEQKLFGVHTGSSILADARKATQDPEERKRIVRELIEIKSKSNHLAPANAKTSKAKSRLVAKKPEPAATPSPAPAPASPDLLKQAISDYTKRLESLTAELLFRLGSSLDAHESADIYQDFMETLKLQLNELRQNIQRGCRRTLAQEDRVGRVRFMQACEVLGIPGAWGKPIDLKLAKQRKWERARQLHPDRNGGSREHEVELQGVMDAYDILEQYSQQQKNHGGQR